MPNNPVDEYMESVDHLVTSNRHLSGLVERFAQRWIEFTALCPRALEYTMPETREEFLAEITKIGNILEEMSDAVQADTMAHVKIINSVDGLTNYMQGIIQQTIKDLTQK